MNAGVTRFRPARGDAQKIRAAGERLPAPAAPFGRHLSDLAGHKQKLHRGRLRQES